MINVDNIKMIKTKSVDICPYCGSYDVSKKTGKMMNNRVVIIDDIYFCNLCNTPFLKLDD